MQNNLIKIQDGTIYRILQERDSEWLVKRNREQYELNIPKVLKGKPKNGIYGFHFSKKLDCVFRYYPFDFYNRYFKVKALVEKKDYDNEWSMSFAAKEIILCEEIYPKYEEVKEYLKYTTAKYHKTYQLV